MRPCTASAMNRRTVITAMTFAKATRKERPASPVISTIWMSARFWWSATPRPFQPNPPKSQPANPLLGHPRASREKRDAHIACRGKKRRIPARQESDKPGPECEIERKKAGEQRRQANEPRIPEQRRQRRAEPREGNRKKDEPGNVTQQRITQPRPPAGARGEPDRRDERRERDPDEPSLVPPRKAEREEAAAHGGACPRPEGVEARCEGRCGSGQRRNVFDHELHRTTARNPAWVGDPWLQRSRAL